MPDNLTQVQRSYCMSRVHGSNTALEICFRKALFRQGVRYRLRYPLEGKPDLVFVRNKIALFVDSCFWHGCSKHAQIPQSNREFWARKLEKNKARDRRVNARLRAENWRVIRVWEHDIKANLDNCIERVTRRIREKATR